MPLLKRPTPLSPPPIPLSSSSPPVDATDNGSNSAGEEIPENIDPQISAPPPTEPIITLPDPAGDEIMLNHLELDENYYEDEVLSRDDNMNLIRVKKKKKGLRNSIFNPSFRFLHIRNPTVLNLFGDFARLIGFKSKRKVHFPDEVIKAAEDKGETSPDGNIPLTNFPYRATYSQKKSKVVRVVRGPEFRPKLAWITDTSKFEVRCERFLTSCSCLGEYKSPKAILKEKAKKKKHNKNHGGDGTPKLSKLTESFMYHVNIADFFLIAHKTRTLSSALEYVDGAEESQKIKINIISKSPSKDSGKSHQSMEQAGILDDNGFDDDLPPLSTSRLGRLATNIWIFGSCVPLLFSTDDPPSEASYRKLMGYLAGIAISANDAGKDIIKQSQDFHNYAEEAMRVIRNLQLKMFLEGDTSVQPPLHMGSGLQLAKRHVDRPPFEIIIAKSTAGLDESLEFKRFADLGKIQKLNALKNLAVSTLSEFDIAKHQIDFLVDDVKETTYDSKNDTDLLYRLSEMYHCIVNISAKSQSRPTEKSVTELKMICETMSKFVLSLNSFICASEHVMEKIMEVRDMVQLTYIYLQEDVEIDLSKLMPADTPARVASKMGFSKDRKKRFCCGRTGPMGQKRVKKEYRTPKYSGSDFFRVFYEDAFEARDVIVEGYVFRVRPLPQDEILTKHRKSSDHPKPIIRFHIERYNNRLGSMDTIDFESNSRDSFGDGEDVPLRPILKDVVPSPAIVSTEAAVELHNNLVRSERPVSSPSEEEDDEPVLERRGMDSVVFTKKSDMKDKNQRSSS